MKLGWPLPRHPKDSAARPPAGPRFVAPSGHDRAGRVGRRIGILRIWQAAARQLFPGRVLCPALRREQHPQSPAPPPLGKPCLGARRLVLQVRGHPARSAALLVAAGKSARALRTSGAPASVAPQSPAFLSFPLPPPPLLLQNVKERGLRQYLEPNTAHSRCMTKI